MYHASRLQALANQMVALEVENERKVLLIGRADEDDGCEALQEEINDNQELISWLTDQFFISKDEVMREMGENMVQGIEQIGPQVAEAATAFEKKIEEGDDEGSREN